MDKNLKRIVVLSVINGIAIYYFNKWLDKKALLPKPVTENEKK